MSLRARPRRYFLLMTDMKRPIKADWTVPALLLALSVVPMIGGVARLLSLSPGVEVSAENARFVLSPAPVLIHVVSAALFSLLGAFQFSRWFRLRWPGWHRRAGRVLALCGLLVGGSGMWMTAFYPIPSRLQGAVLRDVRMLVAAAMVTSIMIGWARILRGDVAGHEAWMIRGYALAQGAGTQVLVLLPWTLISAESTGLSRDLLMTASWAINVAVAEVVIRNRPPPVLAARFGNCWRSSSRKAQPLP